MASASMVRPPKRGQPTRDDVQLPLVVGRYSRYGEVADARARGDLGHVEPHACTGATLKPEPSLYRRREERAQPVQSLSFHCRRSEVLPPAGPTREDARRVFGGKGVWGCEALGERGPRETHEAA